MGTSKQFKRAIKAGEQQDDLHEALEGGNGCLVSAQSPDRVEETDGLAICQPISVVFTEPVKLFECCGKRAILDKHDHFKH